MSFFAYVGPIFSKKFDLEVDLEVESEIESECGFG